MTRKEREHRVRDLLRDEMKLLRVKRRVLRVLVALPDDASRSRVLGAAAVLLGHADWARHDG